MSLGPERVPLPEAGRDAVQTGGAAQIHTGCRHSGDSDRHRGVVRPLPRLESERTTADHVDRHVRRRVGELVTGAEGVPGRISQQHSRCPVPPPYCPTRHHATPFRLVNSACRSRPRRPKLVLGP